MNTRIALLTDQMQSLFLADVLAAVSLPASGEIIGSFVVNGDGTVTYTYRVDNQAGLFDVAFWSLDFEFPAPDWNQVDTLGGGDVAVANPNWLAEAGIPLVGLSAQDFVSLDPTADVLTGTVLDGFSF